MAKRSSNEFLAAWMILFAVILVGGLIWVIASETTLAWLVFIGAAAALLVTGYVRWSKRTEVASAPAPAVPIADGAYRMLVLVDDGATSETFRSGLVKSAGGKPMKAFVVAPALSSTLDRWTGDQEAYDKADAQLQATLAALERARCRGDREDRVPRPAPGDDRRPAGVSGRRDRPRDPRGRPRALARGGPGRLDRRRDQGARLARRRRLTRLPRPAVTGSMTWAAEFRRKQYLQGSLWLGPLLGGLAGILLGSVSVLIDHHVDLPAYWQYSPSTATSVLSAVVGATAALTGFVVTASVLAVQMTTGTFSARYMRLWYRSWMPEGGAHRADRHADAVVHAPPARRGGLRPESRRHDGRAAAVCVRAAVRRLLRRLPAPDAACRGRGARRRRGAQGVRGQRADLGRSGRSVPRHRGLPVIRRARARRAKPAGRIDPGDPRQGTHELRAASTTACSSCRTRSETSSRRARR